MRLSKLDPTGSGRLIQRVLHTYQSSVARLLPQLLAARRNRDAKGIGSVAHTLKSSSGSIGALRFAGLCAEVEAIAASNRTDGLDARVGAMLEELQLVLESIGQLLDSMQ